MQYVFICFGAVFFCTYKEYKPLINLSGSPESADKTFADLATPCCMHAAHGHIHSSAIIPLHSSKHSLCCNNIVALIHHLSHSSILVRTVLAPAQERAGAPICVALSRVHTFARALVFLCFQCTSRLAAAAQRCLTVRVVLVGRRIWMQPGRPLSETA